MFVLFIPVLWRFQEKAELRKMQVVVSAAATAFSKDIKEVRKHLREAGSSAEDSRNGSKWWAGGLVVQLSVLPQVQDDLSRLKGMAGL